jgi:hypothetical protein
MRAPIPHPGNVGDYIQRAVVAVEGRHYLPQYSYLGSYTYPTRNLCGYLTFGRMDADLRLPETEVVADDFGVLVYAANSPFETKQNWSTACDYTFVDEEVEPATIPKTYKPVVSFVVEAEGPTGFPVGGFGMSETLRDFPYYYLSGGGRIRVSGGSARLGSPVTQRALRGRLGAWKSLPSTAKRRTMVGGYYGNDFTATESQEGRYTGLTSGFWWLDLDLSEDITDSEDAVLERGWTGDVSVRVRHVTRQNRPVVIDSKKLSVSPRTEINDIYNSGNAETILLEPITSGKWLDGHGTYDTAGVSAFSGVGWTPAAPEDWAVMMGDAPSEAQGGKTMLRFLSADGGTYRVRLKVRVWLDSALTDHATPQADVSPGAPGDIEIELPDTGDWVFHSLTVDAVWVMAGSEWELLPDAGVVSSMPGGAVRILSAMIARRGRRWGFVEHVQAGEWPEDLPGGIYHSAAARFFRKRIFRLRRSASSAK